MGKLIAGLHGRTISTRLRYVAIAAFSLILGFWFYGTLSPSVWAIPSLGLTVPLVPPHHRRVSTDVTYDAIIVGGGPSGLSALSALARMRRNVLLIDSGVYRNDPTRRLHDVLGFDG